MRDRPLHRHPRMIPLRRRRVALMDAEWLASLSPCEAQELDCLTVIAFIATKASWWQAHVGGDSSLDEEP